MSGLPHDPGINIHFRLAGHNRVAYNTKIVKTPLKVKTFLSGEELAGKFTLLDDARETLGMALKILGEV